MGFHFTWTNSLLFINIMFYDIYESIQVVPSFKVIEFKLFVTLFGKVQGLIGFSVVLCKRPTVHYRTYSSTECSTFMLKLVRFCYQGINIKNDIGK